MAKAEHTRWLNALLDSAKEIAAAEKVLNGAIMRAHERGIETLVGVTQGKYSVPTLEIRLALDMSLGKGPDG